MTGSKTTDLIELINSVERPVVLIDGGSGSGKTTFAALLAPALGAQLVQLDDFYPGWDGLEEASAQVVTDVLREKNPGFRRWDWIQQTPAEWHELDASRPLVIEGCGSLSGASRARATFAIWLELDAPTRKARALARDGDRFAPFWDRWAAQEAAFGERERPMSRADVILSADDAIRIAEHLVLRP